MKHPIQWIVVVVGGCLILAVVFLIADVTLALPLFAVLAKWFWFGAIAISFVPLILLAVISTVNRLRRGNKDNQE